MNRPAGCGGEGATGRTSAPICHDETRGCAHERKVGSGQEGPRRGDALAPYRADQGNAVAQEYIGYLYQNGFGAQQDYAEAMRWHRMAADQRNIRGQNNVGYLYQSGVGVKQDYTEAMRWHRMAADQGNAWAQINSDTCTRMAWACRVISSKRASGGATGRQVVTKTRRKH